MCTYEHSINGPFCYKFPSSPHRCAKQKLKSTFRKRETRVKNFSHCFQDEVEQSGVGVVVVSDLITRVL